MGVHSRKVAADTDNRSHELSGETAGKAGAVVGAYKLFIEFQIIDRDTGFHTELDGTGADTEGAALMQATATMAAATSFLNTFILRNS